MITQEPNTLFLKSKGWSGDELIDNAKLLGYILKRVRGDHFILFHPGISDTVVIPKKSDMRRLDSQIVKQLRRAERIINLKSLGDSSHLKSEVVVTVMKTQKKWFDPKPSDLAVAVAPPKKDVTIFKGNWFTWVKSVREKTGLSQKATAELFHGTLLTEALLGLVEVGKRKFSQAELDTWKTVFDVTDCPVDIPVASELELQRRETWHKFNKAKIKVATSSTTSQPAISPAPEPVRLAPIPSNWFDWVKSIRVKTHLTLREVTSRMGEKIRFTALHDIERGKRRFHEDEFALWNKVFGSPVPPMEIPMAKFRMVPSHGHVPIHAPVPASVKAAPEVVAQPVLILETVPQAIAPDATPAPVEISSREGLVARSTRILLNTHLSDDQANFLVNQMMTEALAMLGF